MPKSLDFTARRLFWDKLYIREMHYEEIANEYGLTYNAVRMKLYRCLKLAMKLVAKHD